MWQCDEVIQFTKQVMWFWTLPCAASPLQFLIMHPDTVQKLMGISGRLSQLQKKRKRVSLSYTERQQRAALGVSKKQMLHDDLVEWWKKAEEHAAALAKLHGISTKSMLAHMEHRPAIAVKSGKRAISLINAYTHARNMSIDPGQIS